MRKAPCDDRVDHDVEHGPEGEKLGHPQQPASRVGAAHEEGHRYEVEERNTQRRDNVEERPLGQRHQTECAGRTVGEDGEEGQVRQQHEADRDTLRVIQACVSQPSHLPSPSSKCGTSSLVRSRPFRPS